MRTGNSGYAAFVCSAVLGIVLSGCANRQVMDAALNRSLQNNKLLAQEQAKQMRALESATDSNAKLASTLRDVLVSNCKTLNSYVASKKQELAHRMRTRFDDAAFQSIEDFNVAFNSKVAPPLLQSRSKLTTELTALQTPALTNDMRRNLDVAKKNGDIARTVAELATQNVQFRDQFISRLLDERTSFLKTVDETVADLQAPAENCDQIGTQFAGAIRSINDAGGTLSKYQQGVDSLYNAQNTELQTIRENVNRRSIVELVIEGAKDDLLDKVRDLSAVVQNKVTAGETLLTAALEQANTSLDSGITKVQSEIDSRGTKLEGEAGKSIDRVAKIQNSVLNQTLNRPAAIAVNTP